MDDLMRKNTKELRRLTSEDAATWLIEQYPDETSEYGQAITLLSHRSWKKVDQLRLARYYLKNIPFASSKPYEVFASVMSLSNLLKVIQEYWPKKEKDCNLLLYHLKPVLTNKIKSATDKEIVNQFLSSTIKGVRPD